MKTSLITRREALAAGVAVAASASHARAAGKSGPGTYRLRISLAGYSFRKYLGGGADKATMTLEAFIDLGAAMQQVRAHHDFNDQEDQQALEGEGHPSKPLDDSKVDEDARGNGHKDNEDILHKAVAVAQKRATGQQAPDIEARREAPADENQCA